MECACIQRSDARERPKRGLTGARTALAGPSATCHHPQARPAPTGAASELPRNPKGANSRPIAAPTWAPQNGHQQRAPLSDLATTPRTSGAALRAPRTPPTPLHALPTSPAACPHLWRRANAATAAAALRGRPMAALLAARWRHIGGAWHGLWAGAARRQRRLRWAALAAVARRARMRRFDFWHAARTSLGRSRRAVKRPPKAVMVALATARTRAVGPAPLTHRAATSVAPAHAYRHTSARQDRADGGGGDRVQALGAAADLQRPLKDLP